MLPRAYVVHRLGGRIRLRVPEKRRDAQWLAEGAERLGRLPGVEDVVIGPAGSLLIHCEDSARLEGLLPQSGLFRLEPDPIPGPGAGAALLGREGTDHGLGSAELRTLLALLFVVLAIVQIVRGQILVPAISLLWYAATLALGPVGPMAEGSNGSSDAPAPSE